MPNVNTITTTSATLSDGSVVTYRDSDPSHIREGNFRAILDGSPLTFHVTDEGGNIFGVDLITGGLFVGESLYSGQPPVTPLRLIYYKHMVTELSGASRPMCLFFVVGWQTTVDDKNERLGLKVFPAENRWEITSDI